MPKVITKCLFHESAQSLESRGHQNSLNYPLKYTPFGFSDGTLGELNLIGFEEASERIVKRLCKCHLWTPADPRLENKQIDSTYQTKSHPQIVCWTCKGLWHYLGDCEVNRLESRAKIGKRWKSKVSTHIVGSQTASLWVC